MHVLHESDGWSGAITLGWLAPRVLYVCPTGTPTPRLVDCAAARLQQLLEQASEVRCFVNAWDLALEPPPSRSALAPWMFRERSKISSLIGLAATPAVAITLRRCASLMGATELVVGDPAEFEDLLSGARPDWRQLTRSGEFELTTGEPRRDAPTAQKLA